MLRYDVVTSVDQLKQYEKEWSAMLESENNDNPFIEFEWVSTWWQTIGMTQRVEIYIVKHEQEVVAILPFVHSKLLAVDCFDFVGNGFSNYMDVITTSLWRETAITFIVNQLIKELKQVVFNLHGMIETGKTSTFLEKHLIQKQLSYSMFRVITPIIDFSSVNLIEYKKKLRKKYSDTRRREKKLRALGNVELQEVGKENLNEMFELFQKRWSKKVDTSGMGTKEVQLFHQWILEKKRDDFFIDVLGIFFEQQLIGFTYVICCRGRRVFYTITHDPTFNIFKIGHWILRDTIDRAIQCDIRIFDLGIGYEPYKMSIYSHVTMTRRYIVSSNGDRAKIVRWGLACQEYVKSLVKKSRRLVDLKRNTIGEIRYLFTKAKFLEWKEFLTKKFSTIFSYSSVGLYCYKTSKNKETINFKEVTLQEALLSKKSTGLVNSYFQGFKLYKSSNHQFTFRRNNDYIREETVRLMEKLQPNSTYITCFPMKKLPEIVDSIGHETELIWTTIDWRFFQTKKEIQKQGFKRVEKISKIKIFRWEKIKRKTV